MAIVESHLHICPPGIGHIEFSAALSGNLGNIISRTSPVPPRCSGRKMGEIGKATSTSTTRPRRPEIDGRSIDVASANSRRVVRPFDRCCRKCSFHSVIVKTICFGNREMGLLASFYLSEEGDNINGRELQVYVLPNM